MQSVSTPSHLTKSSNVAVIDSWSISTHSFISFAQKMNARPLIHSKLLKNWKRILAQAPNRHKHTISFRPVRKTLQRVRDCQNDAKILTKPLFGIFFGGISHEISLTLSLIINLFRMFVCFDVYWMFVSRTMPSVNMPFKNNALLNLHDLFEWQPYLNFFSVCNAANVPIDGVWER